MVFRKGASYLLANADRTNFDEFMNEALDMAIKALEHEPCEDCISRQAVLDLARSLTRWCVRTEDGKFNNVGLLYDDVMFGIDKLPSVTPKPKTDVLDKIRAEISELPTISFDYDVIKVEILEIIDKYKAESEG